MPPKKRKVNAFAGWEEVFSSLTIEQLKGELIKAGEEVGPIDSSNKDIYVRMLVRKKIKLETEAFPTAASLSTTADSLGIVNPLMRKPLSDSGQGMDLTHAYPAAKGVSSTTSKRPGRKTTTKAQKSNLQSIKDFKLEGLIAATYTPLKDDGELNLPVIKKYIDWLLSSGVKNVFINGTAGESLSLTVEERKLVAEEWHKVSGGRMKIIAHIGTESLKNTCELAKHALDCGIDAIGVMPTTYFKPSSIDNLIMYLQKVADAAPTLPMFYYHIPPMTGINLNVIASHIWPLKT